MNSLAALIRETIHREGPITFARYMQMALYTPGLGYYEKKRDIGRSGDFFTSISVGPLFGELLAFQFAEWSGSQTLQIVEAGAHDGQLAADILGWIQRQRPELFGRLQYCVVGPSAIHRQWQEERLDGWRNKIIWADDISKIPGSVGYQIIFGNELLDAMPIHRYRWNAAKNWEECLVNFQDEQFVWEYAAATDVPPLDSGLLAALPDSYIMEYSPAAIHWWKAAARVLSKGKLLAIDYGMTNEELLRPERTGGTLRTYSKHRTRSNPLEAAGEQDMTAHVNFSVIENAGLESVLQTDAYVSQEKFLMGVLSQIEAKADGFDAWSPARVKQFQTLTHPDHLGRAFRVLVQSRSAAAGQSDQDGRAPFLK